MKRVFMIMLPILACTAQAQEPSMQILERQFRGMPMEARQFVQPLFWLDRNVPSAYNSGGIPQ